MSDEQGPPVPIPNTEVKLLSADDTKRETARENRSMLTPSGRKVLRDLIFENRIKRRNEKRNRKGKLIKRFFRKG